MPQPASRSARRRLSLVVALLVATMAACTPSEPESGTEVEPPETTTTTLTEQPGSPVVEFDLVEPLQGQLAVVDGNALTVMQPDGSERIEVAGSELTVASQPVWSPDGARLAWVYADGLEVRVEAGVPSSGIIESSEFDTAPFYLSWNDAGSMLGYLRSASGGPELEFGTVEPDTEPEPVAVGTSVFTSWQPNNPAVALHVDGTSLQLAAFTEPPGEPIELLSPTGEFNAPVWIDETTVLLVRDGLLVAWNTEDGTSLEMLQIGEFSRLVLSPDRSRLAYLTVANGTQTIGFIEEDPSAGDEPEEPPPTTAPEPFDPDALDTDPEAEPEDGVRLRVLDLSNGRDRLVTDEPAIAFEWSPNGAYLSWLRAVDGRRVQWHIWSVAGEAAVFEPYLPSQLDANAYLPFFDQYAQSHNRWDPEGRAMAFAGTIDGQAGIWIQFVDEDIPVTRVSDGDHATWSPPPGGGGGASIL